MTRLPKSAILKAQKNQTLIKASCVVLSTRGRGRSLQADTVFDLVFKVFGDDEYFWRDATGAYVLQHPKTAILWLSVVIIAFS